MLFRPSFHLAIVNLEVSTRSSLDMVILGTSQVKQQVGTKDGNMIIESLLRVNHTIKRGPGSRTSSSTLSHAKSTEPLVKPARTPTSGSKKHSFQDSRELENTIDCNFSEAISDYCKIKGMVRIHGRSSTIFTSNSAGNKSWLIRPYPRKGSDAMTSVREWTIKPGDQGSRYPECNQTHAHPIILFSMAGFSGNYFHAFSDIIIPLFTNSQIFNGKVHLLVTNYKGWWITKFQVLLDQLSYHQVVDIDRDDRVHCYPNAVIGLRSHRELGIDSSRSPNGYSMKDFRNFMRSAYSLERQVAIKLNSNDDRRPPRLMIISRKATRRLTNEASIVKMARNIGYEVVMANVTHTTNLSRFAQVVNSCDVFMGVHGAGLTNMVFLPDNAVVVQVVPLGGIEGFAKTDFGEPSKEMKLRYLKYSIRVKESSLSTKYAADDVVLRDPMVIHRRGWDAIRNIYLLQQNVKLDVRRFRSTLLKALKLLRN
ncbi:hypothetical protein L1887_17121 [Cichorium endivia]|nr:hypothetical protein L1887_17121 [Cichorium endivia]